jgi:hypothetical protein
LLKLLYADERLWRCAAGTTKDRGSKTATSPSESKCSCEDYESATEDEDAGCEYSAAYAHYLRLLKPTVAFPMDLGQMPFMTTNAQAHQSQTEAMLAEATLALLGSGTAGAGASRRRASSI